MLRSPCSVPREKLSFDSLLLALGDEAPSFCLVPKETLVVYVTSEMEVGGEQREDMENLKKFWWHLTILIDPINPVK